MILRFLRWIDRWLSYVGGEAAILQQRKNPDYHALIKQAEDLQKNKGYQKTLTDTMDRAGIPSASKLLIDMITLYVAQLETSTFLNFKYETTMPIPIKNPEKLMFLRFTLYYGDENSSNRDLKYKIRDAIMILVDNQKYESSYLIDGVFEGRSSAIRDTNGQRFVLNPEEMKAIKSVMIDLQLRNENWARLQRDVARQKQAVDMLENYLGIQQPALPAPEVKPEPVKAVEDKKPNPFDELQSELSGTPTSELRQRAKSTASAKEGEKRHPLEKKTSANTNGMTSRKESLRYVDGRVELVEIEPLRDGRVKLKRPPSTGGHDAF